jgi:hypothetical protein
MSHQAVLGYSAAIFNADKIIFSLQVAGELLG